MFTISSVHSLVAPATSNNPHGLVTFVYAPSGIVNGFTPKNCPPAVFTSPRLCGAMLEGGPGIGAVSLVVEYNHHPSCPSPNLFGS